MTTCSRHVRATCLNKHKGAHLKNARPGLLGDLCQNVHDHNMRTPKEAEVGYPFGPSRLDRGALTFSCKDGCLLQLRSRIFPTYKLLVHTHKQKHCHIVKKRLAHPIRVTPTARKAENAISTPESAAKGCQRCVASTRITHMDKTNHATVPEKLCCAAFERKDSSKLPR